MGYQPIMRDGVVVKDGERACDDRYDVIKARVLNYLPGDISVLDLGAAEGYFSARVVEDTKGHVFAVDPNPKLREIASDRIHVLSKKLEPSNMANLPRHDVVLALSVLHHFQDWRAALSEILACRYTAVIEIPDPAETWMRRSAARNQLKAIYDTVKALPYAQSLGTFERTAPRGGGVFQRPMFAVTGTLMSSTGTVFGGSGNNSRSLNRYGNAQLAKTLGYQPFPGSLNLKMDPMPTLGTPPMTWRGKRLYKIWRAWLNDRPVHAMIPTTAHKNTLEVWAPVKLRDAMGITDGDQLRLDVEVRRG